MNNALKAALAVAAGLGLAAGAQAHGVNAPARHTQATPPGQMSDAGTNQKMNRQQIRQAQEQLKQQGLYKGRINGVLDHPTRLALSKFQGQNGLPHTATLDQRTFERLTSGTAGLGVGSSTPTDQKRMQNAPNAGASGATSMNPPSATSAPTGAGGANSSSTTPSTMGSPKQP